MRLLYIFFIVATVGTQTHTSQHMIRENNKWISIPGDIHDALNLNQLLTQHIIFLAFVLSNTPFYETVFSVQFCNFNKLGQVELELL